MLLHRLGGLRVREIPLKLLHQGVAFRGVPQDLLVEHGFHQQDLGDIIRLLVLVLRQQGVELFEFGRQVGLGLFTLAELGLDFGDQRLEFSGGGGGFGGNASLTNERERQDNEGSQEFGFHVQTDAD